MPLERSKEIYQATAVFVERQRAELERWHQQLAAFKNYIQGAASFLETADWQPPQRTQVEAASGFGSADAGLREQSAGTRLLAEKISDASVKRVLIEIADVYDALSAVPGETAKRRRKNYRRKDCGRRAGTGRLRRGSLPSYASTFPALRK